MRRRLLFSKTNAYLTVIPTSPQWINTDDTVIYNVESNTNWKIN